MRAVTDAGPLIHLSWVDRLDLLNALFEEVLVPASVRDEVLEAGRGSLGLDRLEAAFAAGRWRVERARERDAVRLAGSTSLDAGETAALHLLAGTPSSVFLTDDTLAPAEAERRQIPVIGTVGIIVRARSEGIIREALPVVLELRRLGQWMSDSLVQFVRELEGG